MHNSTIALNLASAYPILAPGLTLGQWHPADMATGEAARTFCLGAIKDTYGYDYRPDWHADLDSLRTGTQSWYAPESRGTLLIVRNESGEVVATGGICPITRKPGLLPFFKGRYASFESVAALGRTYINPAYRGQGLSRTLVAMLELVAKHHGFSHLNLHCDLHAARLRNHWQSLGFQHVLNDEDAAHYDKTVYNTEDFPYSETSEQSGLRPQA